MDGTEWERKRAAIRARKWELKHPEQLRQRKQEYYQRTREQRLAYQREYHKRKKLEARAQEESE